MFILSECKLQINVYNTKVFMNISNNFLLAALYFSEFKPILNFILQQLAWSKRQSQYIIANSLTETICMVFLTLLFAYLIYKVLFYFLYLFLKKYVGNVSCNFLQRTYENFSPRMVCVWFDPFAPKKHTFIVAFCQQIFKADIFKRSFWFHVSHKISKFTICFSLPCLYTKVNSLPACLQS